MLKTIIAFGMLFFVIEAINLASGGELYVASLKRLAQDTQAPAGGPQLVPVQEQPIQQQPPIEENGNGRDYIDPEEIRGTLREIKDIRLELKRFAVKAKKAKGLAGELERINAMLAELDRYQKILSSTTADNLELREANDEFRENNYWDEIEKFRLTIEFPKEAKQANLIMKRVEKLIKQKSFANLGLNFDKVREYIEATRAHIATVQGHLDRGEIDEAIEVMRSDDDRSHPGEIEGTLHRIRDIKQRTKKVKDAAIRAEIDEVLQEVVNAFNEGEYRDANEALNEYADDLLQLIDKLTRVRWSQEESFSRIRGLEDLINSKLQQMDAEQQQQEQAQPPVQVRF